MSNQFKFDINFVREFRKEFPYFTLYPNHIYLDNSSTSLRSSILGEIYLKQLGFAGNLDRSSIVSDIQEACSASSASMLDYLGLNNDHRIMWTSGSTDSVNFLAAGLKSYFAGLESNSVMVIAKSNHHANILPWIQLANSLGLEIITVGAKLDNGLEAVSLIELDKLLSEYTNRVALVAVPSVNNSHGIKADLVEISKLLMVYSDDCLLVVDHAQGLTYQLDAIPQRVDAIFASLHKMFGPTGLGLLTLSSRLVDKIQSTKLGGGIVAAVDLDGSNYKLEDHSNYVLPGTLNLQAIAQVSPLIEWWKGYKSQSIDHINSITQYTKSRLSQFNNLTINPSDSSIVSLSLEDGLATELSIELSLKNIVTRVGKHCAYPWHDFLDSDQSLRLSFAPFNSVEDVDAMIEVIAKFMVTYFD